MGGHGERIAQCKEAIIFTSKSMSMQVDGGWFCNKIYIYMEADLRTLGLV